MEYRIHVPAVLSSSLGATTVLASVPCDRNAKLEKVMISSRTGISADTTNYSQIAVKNGSTALATRLFYTDDLAALTNESLTISGDASVTSSTCLNIEYDFAGTGLAVDCDLVLVFSTARSY